MTDLDLDRLGDLWRQRPTAAEMETLRKTAEAVRRKARWGQWVDNGAAVIVASIVLILVLSHPEVETMLVGSAAIVVLLMSQSRTRRFRAEELRSLTGSTQEMLEQSIARSRATLKRSKFQLLGIIPGFGLGLIVAAMVEGSSGDLYGRIFSEAGLGLWISAAAVLVLAGLAISFGRSMRATRAELERLTALRDVFRAEGSQSGREPSGPAA